MLTVCDTTMAFNLGLEVTQQTSFAILDKTPNSTQCFLTGDREKKCTTAKLTPSLERSTRQAGIMQRGESLKPLPSRIILIKHFSRPRRIVMKWREWCQNKEC